MGLLTEKRFRRLLMKGVRVQSLKGKRDREKGISRHKPSIST